LLFKQLGTEQKETKVTRQRLKRILKQIQIFWSVKAKFEKDTFFLFPSPPAVQQKVPAKKSFSVIHELESPLFSSVDK
jgi:hypothetical protein